MDIQKFPNWLRWLLVPISVVITLFIVTGLTNLFFWLQGKFLGLGDDAWLMSLWKNIFGPGVTGFATVYVGVHVSPAGKKIAAIVIGAVMMMIGGVSLLSFISSSNWWGVVNVIATVVGVGFSIYTTFEEEAKKSPSKI